MRYFIIAFTLITSVIVNHSYAQQQAMFTQYMFNQLVLNPAYAGSHETLSLTALARYQWTGIDGAPNTQTFSAHSPVFNDKVGVGLVVSNDEIGPTNQLNVTGIYSYKIKFNNGSLRFGLQGSFVQYKENFNDLANNNGTDNAFSQNITESAPNFGAGLYYENSRFYAGLSSPFLLNNSFGNEGSSSKLRQHYFATAGYLIDFSPSLKLKPNVLLKAVEGAPMEFDVNANLLIREVLWLGASYRSLDSFDFLMELVLSEQFRIGYAYDQTVTDLNKVSGGTHEFMLNYRLKLSKDKILTPRYF
ncbi:type IX secretion system membrane protein PorP/SprF [Fulvivirga ulvae]|uniref:PorP/SprF family type IX secretion system membrane protein n=1 Tax=Fulvivirga ulvae TaxID=2904245 RepID=UPI001F375A10|nr:type IX secretion system membrane protein PorP/SprF [Fulvivirga ulvae]UII33556.1 type IX secretion system membrane protein PorP/SprF [Fulvivirga ulvae]